MRRVAGAVGLLVGVLAVIAGSRVLLGFSIPGYTVLRPLVWYNVAAGSVSIIAGLMIWYGHRSARRLAASVTAAHLIVLALLAGINTVGTAVAAESFVAMTFRSAVWLAILWVVSRPSSRARS